MSGQVKIQMDHRNDGRLSATIKLIGWDLNDLRAFVSMLWLHPMGRRVAQQVGPAVQAEVEAVREAARAIQTGDGAPTDG